MIQGAVRRFAQVAISRTMAPAVVPAVLPSPHAQSLPGFFVQYRGLARKSGHTMKSNANEWRKRVQGRKLGSKKDKREAERVARSAALVSREPPQSLDIIGEDRHEEEARNFLEAMDLLVEPRSVEKSDGFRKRAYPEPSENFFENREMTQDAVCELLRLLGARGEQELVPLTLQRAQEGGIEIDSDVLTAAIHTLCRKPETLENAVELLEAARDRMEETGVPAPLKGYTAVIHQAVKHGRSDVALRMFNQLLDDGRQPNDVMYVCILQGLCYNREYQKAEDMYSHIVKYGLADLRQNPSAYTLLIKALGNSGRVERAWNVYEDMIEQGHFPNQYTMTSLMKCMTSRPGYYDKVQELFSRLQDSGQDDYVATIVYIGAAARAGDVETVESIFASLLESDDPHARRHAYFARVQVHIVANSGVDIVKENVAELMQKAPDAMGTTLLCVLARYYARVCNSLDELMADQKAAGIPDNIMIMTSAMSGYLIGDRPEKAREVYAQILEKGFKPDRLAMQRQYEALVDDFTVDLDDVEGHFNIMVEQGVLPKWHNFRAHMARLKDMNMKEEKKRLQREHARVLAKRLKRSAMKQGSMEDIFSKIGDHRQITEFLEQP